VTRVTALMVATALASASALVSAGSQPAHGAGGPAFTLETTVMVDDGSDTCATEIHIVVDAGETFRICYTMTNTGSEALTAHDVWDSRFGAVAGPGDATVVEPGESWSFTATGANMVSMFHEVTWTASGADSGTEVEMTDYVYITIEDGSAQLDMTVMVDDGAGTCGTETELTIPAGTQVRLCYTMTNTFTEALGPHLLLDEHLGSLLIYEGPTIEVGESLVHTEVAVIQEPAIWISSWESIGVDSDANTLAVDSVRFEIGEPGPDTTTTSGPCVSTTIPPATDPPMTQPPSTMATTTSTTTTTTSTTTTTTQPDTTTTTTTGPGFVLLTTTTTLGEPAGFAFLRHAAAASCPETPPGGAMLPATGSGAPTYAAFALGLVVLGSMVLITAKWRRT
jgi:LPXTG-motif cell wall-anchored protein